MHNNNNILFLGRVSADFWVGGINFSGRISNVKLIFKERSNFSALTMNCNQSHFNRFLYILLFYNLYFAVLYLYSILFNSRLIYYYVTANKGWFWLFLRNWINILCCWAGLAVLKCIKHFCCLVTPIFVFIFFPVGSK